MKENNINKKKVYSKQVKELFLPKITKKTTQLVLKEEHEKKALGL
jgi:hypothetical protein